MKFKLQFLTIVLATICLGIYLQEDISPNQQIVVKFQDSHSLLEDKESTVAQIEDVLTSQGAKKISISTLKDGELKITYYSSDSVQELKEVLSNVAKLDTGIYEQLPSEPLNSDKDLDYDILISELHQSPSKNWDFEGVEVVNQNFKSDRYYQSKISFSGLLSKFSFTNDTSYLGRTEFSNIVFKKDNKFHLIPEVRAGPVSIKIA